MELSHYSNVGRLEEYDFDVEFNDAAAPRPAMVVPRPQRWDRPFAPDRLPPDLIHYILGNPVFRARKKTLPGARAKLRLELTTTAMTV